jgi:3-isopropylmalate dehydrogenase
MAKKVVVLGGDGIGPEVTDATVYILKDAEFDLDLQSPPCGEKVVDEFGTALPDETRDA